MAINGIKYPVPQDSETPISRLQHITNAIDAIRAIIESTMESHLTVHSMDVYKTLAELYNQLNPELNGVTQQAIEASKSLGTSISHNTQQESTISGTPKELSGDRI